jgi:hypothetical protein
MNEDGIRVTQIDWMAAVPSLRLVEAISLAVSLRVMTPVILLILVSVFLDIPDTGSHRVSVPDSVSNLLEVPRLKLPDTIRNSLVVPFARHASMDVVKMVRSAVWILFLGFCGVAAIRAAGCRFSTGTGPGIFASGRHSLKSWKSIFISTLLCGILLALFWVMFRVLCWTGDRTHIGITAATSMLYLIVCLVLGFGWLLSLAAIAIDRCDGAEALSRGICYVLSRWQRLVVYATVCWLMLMLSDFVLSTLTANAYSLALGKQTSLDSVMTDASHISLLKSLEFFTELYHLSLFFCEIVIVYVLLRNVEDGVSLQEIDGGRVSNT